MEQCSYAWARYADLQNRSSKIQQLGDYASGVDRALSYLLDLIATDTVPSKPAELDAALCRTIASGARLYRSHAAALGKWVAPAMRVSINSSAEAAVELTLLAGGLKDADAQILLDAGLGFTDKEIACRHASSPGAVRARLSRLRGKLASKAYSTGGYGKPPHSTSTLESKAA